MQVTGIRDLLFRIKFSKIKLIFLEGGIQSVKSM